jgi:hypothetical protein
MALGRSAAKKKLLTLALNLTGVVYISIQKVECSMSLGQICYLRTTPQGSCLVVNSPQAKQVLVIWLDPIRGTPVCSGIQDFDTFPTIDAALASIKRKNKVEEEEAAPYLIGGLVFGGACYILLVSQVDDRGLLFGVHRVYCVVATRIVRFPLCGSHSKATLDLNSYLLPIAGSHFFCPTFDITSPLDFPPNMDMVWNAKLRRRFDFLPFPNPCVSLLQGGFFEHPIGDARLFLVIRRRFTGTTSAQTCSLDPDGNVTNETEIEVIGERPLVDGHETISHVVLRASAPLARTTAENEMYLPKFLQRVLDGGRFTLLTFVEVGHWHGCVGTPLYDHLKAMGRAFHSHWIPFDWDCLVPVIDLRDAVDSLYDELHSCTDRERFTAQFRTVTGVTTRHHQTSLLVVTCPTGVDDGNLVSFCLCLKVAVDILRILGIADVSLSAIAGLRSVDRRLVGFVKDVFVRTGDMLANLFRGSPSTSSQDIQHFPQRIQRPPLISPDRFLINQSQDMITLFRAKFAEFTSQCVSIYPGIQVIHPQRFDPWIFSTRETATALNLPDQLIIGLQRPVRIEEVVFRNFGPDQNDTPPAVVSVSGGMYVNRMFPILTDLALVRSDDEWLRFQVSSPYCTGDLLAQAFQFVRFLQFTFFAPSVCVSIGNIFVFGSSDKLIPISRGKSNFQIQKFALPDLRADEIETRRSIFRTMEEARIRAGLTQVEFNKTIARDGTNPYVWSQDYFLTPRTSDAPEAWKCAACQKKECWVCGSCERTFCASCSRSVAIGRPKVVVVCLDCANWHSYMITQELPKLHELKRDLLKYRYPFITKNYAILNQFTGIQLVYEPPDGQSGVIAEAALHGTPEFWDPVENIVCLSVMFKQAVDLEAVTIACKWPLVLELDFDSVQPMHFEPPMTKVVIGRPKPKDIEDCGVLNFRITGSPIEIGRISFTGRPVSHDPTDHQPLQITCGPATISVPGPPVKGEPERMMHGVRLRKKCRVYGVRFSEFRGIREIYIVHQASGVKKTLRFAMPYSKEQILLNFPWCCECESMRVMYVTRPNVKPNLPQIDALVVGA